MSKVKHLLDLTENFWNMEDFSNNKNVQVIKTRLRYFKWFFFYFLLVATLTLIIGYYYKPYFTNSRVLIYDDKIPESNLMYYVVLIVETYSIWITGFACITFDLFFATILILTSAQFRMLGMEFKNLIEKPVRTNEDKIETKRLMKKCVDHHNFLFG